MLDTIKALRDGNHLAFEELFNNCYESLCRYAYSILKDMDEAEDVVQKSFFILWDQHKNLNIQSTINSYLYRIVHNESLNAIHQTKNHQEHNLKYLLLTNKDMNNTIENIESSDLQKSIDKAFTLLPPQCRRVFEMSRVEQLTYSEIAKELNISTNTVENHISKALKLFRSELREFLSVCFLFQLLK